MQIYRRSTNLDLIRWMHGGHKAVTVLFKNKYSSSYVSLMATGSKPITDEDANIIESVLGLSVGWLDRDNTQLLRMRNEEYELWNSIAELNDKKVRAVIDFISTL